MVQQIKIKGGDMKKIFEINGKVEVYFDEPFVMGPEMTPGEGRIARGYIKFRKGDNSALSEDEESTDTELCWPVWMGELQGMFRPDEQDAYYDRCNKKKIASTTGKNEH